MAPKVPDRNPGRTALLDQLEARINAALSEAMGLMHTVRLGLLEVRDQELWREAGHSSFDDYCEQRWNMSRSATYRAVVWAREMIAELGTPEAVEATSPAARMSDREAVARARARRNKPPRGKAEAIEVEADDTRTPEVQPVSTNGSGPSPSAGGAASPRGAQQPLPPRPTEAVAPMQLSLFPATKLLEHLINERAAEVLALEGRQRKQVATRLRRWADQLDPIEKPKKSPTVVSVAQDRVMVTPNFKKGKQ